MKGGQEAAKSIIEIYIYYNMQDEIRGMDTLLVVFA